MKRSALLLSWRINLARHTPPGEAVAAHHFERVPSSAPVRAATSAPSTRWVRCSTLTLSVDPFLRCRFFPDSGVDYTHSYAVGAPISSAGLGVVAEDAEGLRRGQLVLQAFDAWPWSDDVLMPVSALTVIPPSLALLLSPSHLLGALGTTGLTAYCGALLHPQAPLDSASTLVVSGGAGATGHLVGQLAKQRGAHVVGVCGDARKAHVLHQRLGFDAAVNRRSARFADELARALDGREVTHYFDSAGGPVTDSVIARMGQESEIILCGAIEMYDRTADYPPPLPQESEQLVRERSIIRNRFLVLNYREHFASALAFLARDIAAEKLVALEHSLPGERPDEAFIAMMSGNNLGKALVHVAPLPERVAAMQRICRMMPARLRGALTRRLVGESQFSALL